VETFESLLYQLHLSYLQARKNKRNTQNQLAFELDQEQRLHTLASCIHKREYKPKPSIAFIIHKPVMREIFAADFIDRIVHHLIYRCIYPEIDCKLIYDTYSCRVGKGTLFGIQRAQKFIRSCSLNHTREAYVLKVDIEAYFMNMQHQLIYDKVIAMLPENKEYFLGISRETVLYLLRQTIFNKVTQNCRIKGNRSDWHALPVSKSLFSYPDGTGLPIGNLTSQVFGNVYLNEVDHFIKSNLKIKFYGRYVDDMLFVHHNRDYLSSIVPIINHEVNQAGLRLHPNKIVLTRADDGIPFLGQLIKPYRNYISNRTKDHFYQAIQSINRDLKEISCLSWDHLCAFRAVLNSYLGTLGHANTFALRRAMINRLDSRFYAFFNVDSDLKKVCINQETKEWHFTLNYQHTK
jgi:RNA-directed DNA polymerase